jgi:hypothetical protein
MGWWKARGNQVVVVVGDEPLDVLGVAVSKVVKQYENAFRRPTVAEWEVLLQLVLGLDEPEYRSAEDGVPAEIRITPCA